MPTKVIHLASELTGGAGVAALRLHEALTRTECNSILRYGFGYTSAPGTEQYVPDLKGWRRHADRVGDSWRWKSCRKNSGLFTRTRRFGRGHNDLALDAADIVHLHWVSKWLDYPSLFKAIPPQTPIVLTLHDACFFTGGCHLTGECTRYQDACGRCPRLKVPHVNDAAARGFHWRARLYKGRSLAVVPVSNWMGEKARAAALLRQASLHDPIYPGVDTSIFRPLDRIMCRQLLRLPPNKFIVCAGAADLSDANKGMPLLLEALHALPPKARSSFLLLTYGSGCLPPDLGEIPIRQLGFVSSPELLAVIYAASDVYCTPSHVESFGMTAIEAGACGIPVVAFRTGGLTEAVAHGKSGILVDRVGDTGELSATFARLHQSPIELAELSAAARKRVVRLFSIETAAARYNSLYEQLLSA